MTRPEHPVAQRLRQMLQQQRVRFPDRDPVLVLTQDQIEFFASVVPPNVLKGVVLLTHEEAQRQWGSRDEEE